MDNKKGFTLIELLVVISVIAILLAILMPALNKASESGKRINCLANVKNLTLCWVMYSGDYNGRVPGGGTTSGCWVDYTGITGGLGYNLTSIEPGQAGIKAGLLWPFANNLKLYRCSMATRYEARNYSMPDSYSLKSGRSSISSIGGAPLSLFIDNINNIKRQSERMSFLDEGVSNPGTWSFFYSSPTWWDPVPNRHGNGTCISFVDGHAEYRKWRDARTIKFGRDAMALANPDQASLWRRNEPGNEDLDWLCKAIWSKVGWTQ
jgi:prepilin-type N-terminal cleavage/methylation domain-containing protein/prepilin-type processing-associated H-X9-DG protein